MKKILGFEVFSNYLNKEKMDAMLASPEGEKLLSLARNISACLHEDWKENLVREKGSEYQHFRDVRDAERRLEILSHKEEIQLIEKLLATNPTEITQEQRAKYLSEDGKLLYKIQTQKEKVKDENGKDTGEERDVEVAMFDLIRVPFVNLTQHWQDANLDAAKFALCLVKTCLDQGELNGTPEEIFQVFEKMANDVHSYWMTQNPWADEKLLLPYLLLVVDTLGYNEKDKDRDKINKTTIALTNQSNLPERNRSIVIRAVKELLVDKSTATGLDPDILEKLQSAAPLVQKQNQRDYARHLKNKNKVQDVAQRQLKGKKEFAFADLEILARVYFENWKFESSRVMDLPDTVTKSYADIEVDDIRVNHKNVARGEVIKILCELEKEGKIKLPPLEKEMKKRIKEQNEKDYLEYQRKIEKLSAESVGFEPGE